MLKPFFPYYGSKWRDAKRYHEPTGGAVFEPFAGSAGYSVFWGVPRAQLYDVDPIIVAVWKYLIRVSPAEVLRLPDLAVGESVTDCAIPQEAKWLIGFWLNRGSAQPKKTRTAFSARTDRAQLVWGARARERIACQVEGIRDWTIEQKSYLDAAPGARGTWFVDPPYVDKGRYYRFHTVDYARLATWCRGLAGVVIVCEQEGARWLPFEPLAIIKSTRGVSSEVVFTIGSERAPAPRFEQCELFGAAE